MGVSARRLPGFPDARLLPPDGAMKMLGLIGGMSWHSTEQYYLVINTEVADRLGGHSSASLALVSLDFQQIRDCQVGGNWQQAGKILADAGRRLQAAGADSVMICTNLMHKVASDVEAATSLPLLHIADAVAQSAGEARILGLVGTAWTMADPFYRDRLADHGIEVVIPDEPARERLDRIIFDKLTHDVVRPESRREFAQTFADLAGRGAEAVVLACTEIEMLVDHTDSPVPLLDSMAAHARYAVDWAFPPTLIHAADPELLLHSSFQVRRCESCDGRRVRSVGDHQASYDLPMVEFLQTRRDLIKPNLGDGGLELAGREVVVHPFHVLLGAGGDLTVGDHRVVGGHPRVRTGRAEREGHTVRNAHECHLINDNLLAEPAVGGGSRGSTGVVGQIPTRSPTDQPVTPAPTRLTSPDTSWPGVMGSRTRVDSHPSSVNTPTSVWHNPAAFTSTTTCPGPGFGSGTSVSISGSLVPVNCHALMMGSFRTSGFHEAQALRLAVQDSPLSL